MKVILYTKQNCGLCEEAERLLKRIRREIGFDLEIVDIEGDEAAYRRYWDRVPVVSVGGKDVAEAPIDEANLTAVLLV